MQSLMENNSKQSNVRQRQKLETGRVRIRIELEYSDKRCRHIQYGIQIALKTKKIGPLTQEGWIACMRSARIPVRVPSGAEEGEVWRQMADVTEPSTHLGWGWWCWSACMNCHCSQTWAPYKHFCCIRTSHPLLERATVPLTREKRGVKILGYIGKGLILWKSESKCLGHTQSKE